MLLTKDEIDNVKINVNLNDNFNYVEVLLNDKLIHKEKLYKVTYKSRINKVKNLLLFWK